MLHLRRGNVKLEAIEQYWNGRVVVNTLRETLQFWLPNLNFTACANINTQYDN